MAENPYHDCAKEVIEKYAVEKKAAVLSGSENLKAGNLEAVVSEDLNAGLSQSALAYMRKHTAAYKAVKDKTTEEYATCLDKRNAPKTIHHTELYNAIRDAAEEVLQDGTLASKENFTYDLRTTAEDRNREKPLTSAEYYAALQKTREENSDKTKKSPVGSTADGAPTIQPSLPDNSRDRTIPTKGGGL